MPFESKSQARGAFSGAFGPEMKKKAQGWADETPDMKSLPDRKGDTPSKGKKDKPKGKGDGKAAVMAGLKKAMQ